MNTRRSLLATIATDVRRIIDHRRLTAMPNSDLLEYLVLQQLGGGAAVSGQVWLQVAMLVCLFLVAILRPEVVRAKALFRMACVLFALSLLVSPTLNFLLSYLSRLGGAGAPYGRMQGDVSILMSFPSVISAVLFGLSLICGLCSLGLGSAAAAAAKPAQSLARFMAQPASAAGGPEDLPKPRRAPSSGIHPLDEPD